MYCVRKVTDDLYWVGANDHRLHLFENIHPIPRGVSYNAYLLLDEQSVLFDTVDWSAYRQLQDNLDHLLGDKPLDWLVVNHMEPDHCATLGELLRDRMAAFPASGEINSKLAQPAEAIARVEQHFAIHALEIDRTDGISMAFPQWRFNLRSSNTEPVVRLNVESRADTALMEARTKDILALLNQ